MTDKELSRLKYLNIETKKLQEELDELEYSADVTSAKDLKAIIQLNLQKIQIERARLERYIENINDPETRLIFRLRHINGMTWGKIGAELYMSHTSAFRKHERYLKQANNRGIRK